jgi:hypothetical protein
MTADAKVRLQAMLLKEVKEGKREWYYISSATATTFHGGFYLMAHGPTEAWTLYHRLGWHTEGCSTQTSGPIDQDIMDNNVPMEDRWRRLSKEEVCK